MNAITSLSIKFAVVLTVLSIVLGLAMSILSTSASAQEWTKHVGKEVSVPTSPLKSVKTHLRYYSDDANLSTPMISEDRYASSRSAFTVNIPVVTAPSPVVPNTPAMLPPTSGQCAMPGDPEFGTVPSCE